MLEYNKINLLIVDNYINATCPVIKFGKESYITYNKYISESIFKRFLASCEVIYPDSDEYLKLYRKSIKELKKLLDIYNIKNIILIGGRLCKKNKYINREGGFME